MSKLTDTHKNIIKILAAAALFFTGMILEKTVFSVNGYIWLAIYLPSYLIVGIEPLFKACRNILKGKIFDENFLMSIATIGAFVIGQYPEAVAVMLFYQIGELFQDIAVNRSRKSITELMDIRPDYANLMKNGNIEIVDPFDVAVGDTIVIKVGEKIPVDAVVTKGSSYIDTSALTGESLPREVTEGSELLSGCINTGGVLEARVTRLFGESTASKILDLVENASNNKSKSENFITKFARFYTPAVVLAAILLAVIPPVFDGLWNEWVYRALTFLVVSCPCALVISVPLSFFGGIGNASKNGILVKGSNYLEAVTNIDTMVFDKTGTLTKGNFTVKEIVAETMSESELLELAARVESMSNHPIAKAVLRAYGKETEKINTESYKEIAGKGISVEKDNHNILVGNSKLMKSNRILIPDVDKAGTILYVAVDGEYEGYLLIADSVKSDAVQAIELLKKSGVKKTVMLTGDNDRIGKEVANELGLDKAYTELLPFEKVEKVEELLKETKGKLAFVGDGINDAPVLARADVGIAMGGVGSDAAIEAADIVLMTDEPTKIYSLIKIADKTLRIVKQNIWFSLIVKFIVLILSAAGFADMWMAVFADVGVSVIAILNAVRALKYRVKQTENLLLSENI